MSQTKTDNSFFETKVKLRVENLPDGRSLEVLDCFAGGGTIWRAVQHKIPGCKISVLSMDRKASAGSLHLVGDNIKFLGSMDLRRFDVIDLDAYGSPFSQLKMILSKPLKPGVVIVGSFTYSIMLPHQLLRDLGYSPAMVRKMPTLFCRHGREKLLAWLGNHGVQLLKIYSTADGRKNYFSFQLP